VARLPNLKGRDADLYKAVLLQTLEEVNLWEVVDIVAVADYRGSAWRYYSKRHCDWRSTRNLALKTWEAQFASHIQLEAVEVAVLVEVVVEYMYLGLHIDEGRC